MTPTTIDNDTLWVLPGGHKRGLLPHEQLPGGEQSMTGDMPAPEPGGGATPVELQPGQMLVFSGLLPHCSGPNKTEDQVRMFYQLTCNAAGATAAEISMPMLREGRVAED